MTEHTPGIPLGSWLADLPDERLIRLLELRPDLAQPPPGSIAALAARAQARQSLKAASDELDFLRLAVIDALLVLHADTEPVSMAKLLALLDGRAPNPTCSTPSATSKTAPWFGVTPNYGRHPTPVPGCPGTRDK